MLALSSHPGLRAISRTSGRGIALCFLFAPSTPLLTRADELRCA